MGSLPYPANALEPHIDEKTMQIHHGKHHAAYVTNLNAAVAKEPALAGKSLEEILRGIKEVPESVRVAVKNNGGGHHNHTLFWESLTKGGAAPEGAFLKAIDAELGGLEKLTAALKTAGMTVFGSGWSWLCLGADGKLIVEGLPNQDSPLMVGKTPLFGLDVWEHAYYLKYQNRRADYVDAALTLVDWRVVGRRYEAAV